MKLISISLIFLLASSLSARAGKITWRYFTGWEHGFILTVSSEDSSITLLDRDTKTEQTELLQNSEEVLKYFEVLTQKMKSNTVGSYADDGPENQIVFTKNGKAEKFTIYDVSPPHLFLHWKIQDPAFPADDALREADGFLKEIDAFLLLNQLRELKNAYFDESKTSDDPFANADPEGTDQTDTVPELKSKKKSKPKPQSEARTQ